MEFVQVPPGEQGIPAVQAEYWFQVEKERNTRLEGLCFAGPNVLYFVDIDFDILYRLDMRTQILTKVLEAPGKQFASVKVGPDGRLFICSLNPEYGMLCCGPDGSGLRPVELLRGHAIDDLAFDKTGGFYFTELVGECYAPTGGVYYVDAAMRTLTLVVGGLASPNGVALSTDGTVLWVTETTGGRLLRFELDASGLRVAPYGSYSAYHFVGRPGPDSCTIDGADNLYVALYRQGRFMVFQRDGYPVSQILLPDRETGRNLYSSHCKLRPGTDELYMCSSSGPEAADAWIFRCRALDSAPRGNG